MRLKKYKENGSSIEEKKKGRKNLVSFFVLSYLPLSLSLLALSDQVPIAALPAVFLPTIRSASLNRSLVSGTSFAAFCAAPALDLVPTGSSSSPAGLLLANSLSSGGGGSPLVGRMSPGRVKDSPVEVVVLLCVCCCCCCWS